MIYLHIIYKLATPKLLSLLAVLVYTQSQAAAINLYRCDVEGKSATFRTDLSTWLPSAVPHCFEVEGKQRLQLPHQPPDPRPLDWPVFLDGSKAQEIFKEPEPTSALSSTAIGIRAKHHATQYGLSPKLVIAVIKAESAFNHRARSPKGALGLMQVLPSTARDYGVYDPANLLQIDENIRVGTSHLARLMQRFDGDLPLVLAAYNAGEGAVIRSGWRIPPYPETERYVKKIMHSLSEADDKGNEQWIY